MDFRSEVTVTVLCQECGSSLTLRDLVNTDYVATYACPNGECDGHLTVQVKTLVPMVRSREPHKETSISINKDSGDTGVVIGLDDHESAPEKELNEDSRDSDIVIGLDDDDDGPVGGDSNVRQRRETGTVIGLDEKDTSTRSQTRTYPDTDILLPD